MNPRLRAPRPRVDRPAGTIPPLLGTDTSTHWMKRVRASLQLPRNWPAALRAMTRTW